MSPDDITAGMQRSDPALEHFVCLTLLSFNDDTAMCDILLPSGEIERVRVCLIFALDGTLYVDI